MLLIFSADLLKLQTNYHVNIKDVCGDMVCGQTFWPNELDKLPDEEFGTSSKLSRRFNEVVFHDRVDARLIQQIWFEDESVRLKCVSWLPQQLKTKCKLRPYMGYAIEFMSTFYPKLVNNYYSIIIRLPKSLRRYVNTQSKPVPYYFICREQKKAQKYTYKKYCFIYEKTCNRRWV